MSNKQLLSLKESLISITISMSAILRQSVSRFRCRPTTTETIFFRRGRGPNRSLVQSTKPSVFASSRRHFSKEPNNNKNKNGKTIPQEEIDESHLNWKDRKEAPKWMRRIAPGKGGKWPPTPQEAAILVSGVALFAWSWTA